MKGVLRSTALGLLLLNLPESGRAAEAYPQVQVVAKVKGRIFENIAEPELEKLKSETQTRVKDAATSHFSCMEWVTGVPAAKAGVRAQLIVELSQRPYDQISWIYLSFSGVIGNSPPADLWTVRIASILDPSWSPRNVQGLKNQIFRAIAAQFNQQEMREHFDLGFIAYIPIAESIDPDPLTQRAFVHINPERLNLEPKTVLKVTMKAFLCLPEECSRIDLASEGRGDGRFHDSLRCRIMPNDCCPEQSWPPGFADRLRKAKVKVYLAGDHRHCPFGLDNCPGPDRDRDRYRHPGSRP